MTVARSRSPVAGLYAVTPDLDDTALLVALVDAALAGGATMVQYRNKVADEALRHEQAHRLAEVCAGHRRPLVINDHAHLARAIDGAGLHVGADDFTDLDALRTTVGPDRILGVSCYRSVDLARAAAASSADYVAFGSVFASTTKPDAPSAALALFGEARTIGVALVGIGGITHDNLPSLIEAGADAAAAIGDLFAIRDPAVVRARATRLARAFADRSSSSMDRP